MSVLQRRAQPAIVTLPDQVDEANAESVYEQIRAACGPGVTVVADLTSTRSCYSTGIRNITLAHEHAKTLEGQLRLALPAGVVHRVLELLGLDRVLLIYPTVAAAMDGHEAAQSGHPTGQVPLGL
jgi:anti-sigma B factor antagonist